MEGETVTAASVAQPVMAPASKDQATPDAAVKTKTTANVTAESKGGVTTSEKEEVAVEAKELIPVAPAESETADEKPKREKKAAASPAPARTSGREQRVRKSVDAYDPASNTEKKERVIPNGKGEKLEHMPRVVANFKNITWSDPHLSMLYTIVFGRGKKKEFKAHLFQFNGLVFPEAKEEEEREKLKQKMYKLVLGDLKEVMDLCDIDRSAESFGTKAPDKDMLCNRFLEWLECPKSSGKKIKAPTKKAAKKAPVVKADSAKKRGRPKASTSKDKVSAKKAKGNAKAETVEDGDEIHFNIPGASIEKVREKVKSIVENANKEELTVKGVRKLLEEWLDTDLADHKDAVRSLVMEAM